MTPADLAIAEMSKSGLPTDVLEGILSEWEINPFYEGEELTGIALMKGTEFHCHMTESFRLNRASMREFLRPLFDRHGFLTTRVEHNDTANQRLNKMFGFERTWSDDRFHYFMLTELPFERKSTCQQ